MLSFEEFAAAAKQVENITDCQVRVIDERGWEGYVQISVEAYLAKDDGSVEPGIGLIRLCQVQFDSLAVGPGPWLLSSFSRSIKDKHRGYTRYATAEEIAAYKSAKEVA